jgi:hypothetical protein
MKGKLRDELIVPYELINKLCGLLYCLEMNRAEDQEYIDGIKIIMPQIVEDIRNIE